MHQEHVADRGWRGAEHALLLARVIVPAALVFLTTWGVGTVVGCSLDDGAWSLSQGCLLRD